MSMEFLETSMREEVKKLFDEDKIDVVIGYQKGTMPLRSAPAFITKKEDVDKLVWNSCCDINLVNYLLKPEHKDQRVGIVVKGCDARSLAVCINEGQFDRDKVVIIGMPCLGILDRKAIEAKTSPKEIIEANGDVTVKVNKKDGFLQDVPVGN